jgi:hypothetical protein
MCKPLHTVLAVTGLCLFAFLINQCQGSVVRIEPLDKNIVVLRASGLAEISDTPYKVKTLGSSDINVIEASMNVRSKPNRINLFNARQCDHTWRFARFARAKATQIWNNFLRINMLLECWPQPELQSAAHIEGGVFPPFLKRQSMPFKRLVVLLVAYPMLPASPIHGRCSLRSVAITLACFPAEIARAWVLVA